MRRPVRLSVRLGPTVHRVALQTRTRAGHPRGNAASRTSTGWPTDPGGTILDLGASVGLATLRLLASHPGARVVAVEADPMLIPRLEANVAGFPVTVVHAAVAAGLGGTAVLPQRHRQLGQLPGPHLLGPEAVAVPALSLADLLDAQIDHVDLLEARRRGRRVGDARPHRRPPHRGDRRRGLMAVEGKRSRRSSSSVSQASMDPGDDLGRPPSGDLRRPAALSTCKQSSLRGSRFALACSMPFYAEARWRPLRPRSAAPPRRNPRLETVRLQPTRGFSRVLAPRELWRYRDLAGQIALRDITVRYRQTALGGGLGRAAADRVHGRLLADLRQRRRDLLRRPPLRPLQPRRPGPLDLLLDRGAARFRQPRLQLRPGLEDLFPTDLHAGRGDRRRLRRPGDLAGDPDAHRLRLGLVPVGGVPSLPLVVAIAAAAALGVDRGLSAINVRYRDVRYSCPSRSRCGCSSPRSSTRAADLAEPWRTLSAINPMVGVVEGFRWATLGTGNAHWDLIGISAVVAVVFLSPASPTSTASSAPSRTSSEPCRDRDRHPMSSASATASAWHGAATARCARRSSKHAPQAAAAIEGRSSGNGTPTYLWALRRRLADGQQRRGRRHHRPQRGRQEHPAEDPLADHRADRPGTRRASAAGSARCSRSAPASTPS